MGQWPRGGEYDSAQSWNSPLSPISSLSNHLLNVPRVVFTQSTLFSALATLNSTRKGTIYLLSLSLFSNHSKKAWPRRLVGENPERSSDGKGLEGVTSCEIGDRSGEKYVGNLSKSPPYSRWLVTSLKTVSSNRKDKSSMPKIQFFFSSKGILSVFDCHCYQMLSRVIMCTEWNGFFWHRTPGYDCRCDLMKYNYQDPVQKPIAYQAKVQWISITKDMWLSGVKGIVLLICAFAIGKLRNKRCHLRWM